METLTVQHAGRQSIVAVDRDKFSADAIALLAQGHEEAMPRNFGFWSTLSLAFVITNSWVGYSTTFGVCLVTGNGPTVIFGLLVATIVCSIITAGLAELASAFPSSGGQYHFAFMVSSPAYRAPVSFAVGWLSIFAWWMATAAACIVCAQIIMFLAGLWHDDFAAAQWQTYLVYLAVLVIAISFVIFFMRQIPKAEIVFFGMTLVGFVVFFICVLARSAPKQSAKTVFTDFVNITGWTDGFAFMLGASQAMFTYLAIDGATHVAEEMPNPGKGVPRAMGLTMFIGMITVFMWTLAFMFSTSDLEAVAASGVPIITVYQQALRSKVGATVFAVWLLTIFFGAFVSCLVTCGRLVWAFARDNGLPYSKIFDKIHPKLNAPINSTILTGVFLACYGAIYIGSTNAFNSFISLSILGMNMTYVIPQAIVFLRGRDKVLPPRQFSLGPWLGPCCNAFSCVWVFFVGILFCFPLTRPVTKDNMNYLSVVLSGLCLFTLVCWYAGKRKTFTGPNIDLIGINLVQSNGRQAPDDMKEQAHGKLAADTESTALPAPGTSTTESNA
ncbi:hypothetical protein AYO21_04310 [Fonsecaea monophora]|uniref:Amino acid permease/ SLC12A domain-containing protein n=1 Tax=Fonsecaea monophora TaxID=254056 RepID=A0A177FB78_9EURO|nr:hypothetical protein AYO21_04310 [Fonsecaea monophora]OAG41368.1 hypothetical protein AYO21_04310 [Fonsecaea monophora]